LSCAVILPLVQQKIKININHFLVISFLFYYFIAILRSFFAFLGVFFDRKTNAFFLFDVKIRIRNQKLHIQEALVAYFCTDYCNIMI